MRTPFNGKLQLGQRRKNFVATVAGGDTADLIHIRQSCSSQEFQMTVADQRATQKLLAAALNILKGFYAKKVGFL